MLSDLEFSIRSRPNSSGYSFNEHHHHQHQHIPYQRNSTNYAHNMTKMQ